MPEKCVVFGCSNVRNKKKDIKFHPIPFYGKSDSEKQRRRKNWVDFVKLKRAHWEPTKHSTVCSEQFKEEDFTNCFSEDLYVCVYWFVCWSPLLAAQRQNYEGRSLTGSAECIWKAPLAAAKQSRMIPEHSRCFWLGQMFLTWVNARP